MDFVNGICKLHSFDITLAILYKKKIILIQRPMQCRSHSCKIINLMGLDIHVIILRPNLDNKSCRSLVVLCINAKGGEPYLLALWILVLCQDC